MGFLERWSKPAREQRQRERWELMMDGKAVQIFDDYKHIKKHSCDCGACYTDRTIDWARWSANELDYFAAWADIRFTWDHDDLDLLDFADECRRLPGDLNWKRNRVMRTSLKAKA